MLVKNAKIYTDGKFFPGVMEYDEKVKMIRPDEAGTKHSDELSSEKVIFDGETVDAGGCYVIPGLIDIHTHGGRDADAGDGSQDALETLSLDGAMEFIKEVSKTATVSLGHTNADYDVCVKAFENGTSHITHFVILLSVFLWNLHITI